MGASAVLAWLLHERGSDTVDKLLPVAVIPPPNLVEALYRAIELGHQLPLEELHAAIAGMGAEMEPLTEEDADRAAQLLTEEDAGRDAAPPTSGACPSAAGFASGWPSGWI